MILNALKYSEMNITAILVSIGIAIFIFLVKTAIERYFKFLDTKEAAAEKRNCEVTTRLDALKESFIEMSLKYSQMFDKVHTAGVKLDETVKKVSGLEIDVELLKQMNGLKKEKR